MFVMNRPPEEIFDGGLGPDESLDASDEVLVALRHDLNPTDLACASVE
jgi:hypothetical protein